MRRLIAVTATACAALTLGVGPASAQDAWPVDPGEGAPDRPVDVTTMVLTPDQLEFYNPFVPRTRVVSTLGRTTRIVCTGYRTDNDCWQADQFGNPHKLRVIFNLGSVSTPGTNIFVYPGLLPGF